MDKKKKAIPVRKLLEMERRAADTIVNNENDLSDANRSTNTAATSILGTVPSKHNPTLEKFYLIIKKKFGGKIMIYYT